MGREWAWCSDKMATIRMSSLGEAEEGIPGKCEGERVRKRLEGFLVVRTLHSWPLQRIRTPCGRNCYV